MASNIINPVVKRSRRTNVDMSKYLLKHSPLKKGLSIKNEDSPLAMYNKVGNQLFLGNYQAAKNSSFFEKKNITAVLNCTKDLPNYFRNDKKMEYMRIPVDDSLKKVDIDKMVKFFPVAVSFIHKMVVLEKRNILVHCFAGRQRSAIIVACYLVVTKGLNPGEACKYVMEKRPEAFHYGLSLNFDKSLKTFDQNSSCILTKLLDINGK